MNHWPRRVLLAAAFTALAAQFSSPAERSSSWRGRLNDYDSSPMTGSYLLHFKLKDAKDLRSTVWSESIYVPTRRGIYQAPLGRHRALPLHHLSSAYQMKVTVPRGSGWLLGLLKAPAPVARKALIP
mgnify:CR=1 FL=1